MKPPEALNGDRGYSSAGPTAIYADDLADARRVFSPNVERHRVGWRFWWGNPIAATIAAHRFNQ